MKNGPLNEGGPGKAQLKTHRKTICAKSSSAASEKSRRLPPEILSAVARSGRRSITLARPKALRPVPPKASRRVQPAPSVKPGRVGLAELRVAARARRDVADSAGGA
jgi:hypothetical protein